MNIDTEDTVNVIMGNRGSLHGSFRGTPQKPSADNVGDGNSDSDDAEEGLGFPVQAIDPPITVGEL